MKIRSDIIKVYKDVHIWIGITCGLMLFVAFYAGAITMFAPQLERWASPPTTLSAPPALEQAPALVAATLAAHPEAKADYQIVVDTGADAPARVTWRVRGHGLDHGEYWLYGSSFAKDGSLEVERIGGSPIARLVDHLHQRVGLPFSDSITRPIMGTVALAYAVALVSGVIVLLPTLARDVFAMRMGKNIKRMWLDVHNALGIFSLPFHLAMALTSVAFAFHDEFYDAQAAVVYGAPIAWQRPAPHAPLPEAQLLSPVQLLRRIHDQAPALQVSDIAFSQRGGHTSVHAEGIDPRYGSARGHASVGVDPYNGQVDRDTLPAEQQGLAAAVNSFFYLHLGTFGGLPVRWAYFVLGMAGALLFYTGNLLWVESRRRKQRSADPVTQSRPALVMGALTVGVSLGCVAGISATIAAAKWLPAGIDATHWHDAWYFGVFVVAIVWALLRGAARGAHELLWLAAGTSLAIPLSSLAGALGVGTSWIRLDATAMVDLVALLGALGFAWVARRTRQRMLNGHADSIWSVSPADSPNATATT